MRRADGSGADRTSGASLYAGGGGLWLCLFAAALTLFTFTLAPDILMMDSGEYQVAVSRFPNLDLGDAPRDLVRVHPVYLAVAKLVSLVPVGPFAARVNFVSALFGAIAVANAGLLVWLLTGRRDAVVLAALTLSLGHTLWAFAVIAEVMTMVAAIATAELLCWSAWARTGRSRWLLALGLINGLGVATHLQLGLDTIVHAIACAVLLVRGRIRGTQTAGIALAWMAGTLPYSAMVAYYAVHSGDWAGTLASATRGEYGAGPQHVRAWTLARGGLSLLLNYPTLLIAPAIPGAARLWSRRGRSAEAGLLARVLVALAFVQWSFAMTYHVPDQYSFFVPFYALAAVLIGVGSLRVLSRPRWRWVLYGLAVLPVGVYAVAPDVLRRVDVRLFTRALPHRDPYAFFLRPWKTGDRGQRWLVGEVFATIEPDAVLLCSPTTVSMFEVAQRVDRLAPGVTLVVEAHRLAAFLGTDAGGWPGWTRPVYAIDAAAKDFPCVVREHCDVEPVGGVWRIGAPHDPRAFAEALRVEQDRVLRR